MCSVILLSRICLIWSVKPNAIIMRGVANNNATGNNQSLVGEKIWDRFSRKALKKIKSPAGKPYTEESYCNAVLQRTIIILHIILYIPHNGFVFFSITDNTVMKPRLPGKGGVDFSDPLSYR